jgi:gas vesicle protein
MKGFLSFLSGAILGAMFGTAAAMLTTPKPGNIYRADIKREVGAILEEGRRAAQARRAELEEQLAQMRGDSLAPHKKEDK